MNKSVRDWIESIFVMGSIIAFGVVFAILGVKNSDLKDKVKELEEDMIKLEEEIAFYEILIDYIDELIEDELEIKELEMRIELMEELHKLELKYAKYPNPSMERSNMETYIGYIVEYFELEYDEGFDYWLYNKDKNIYEWVLRWVN